MFRFAKPASFKPASFKPVRLSRTDALAAAWIAAVLAAIPSTSFAQQPPMVERAAKGAAAKDIQVGVYVNVLADCTSGALPALRLVTAPSNGTINIKQAKIRATNYKQCLALEVPGFIAFYKSKPDFNGTDTVVIEVKYPAGRTETQKITVTIGQGGPGGRNI